MSAKGFSMQLFSKVVGNAGAKRSRLVGILAVMTLTACNSGQNGSATSPTSAMAKLPAVTANELSNAELTERQEPSIAPARLIWRAPMTREDGSSLYPGEIRGYRVYFKLNHQADYQVMAVTDPLSTSLALDSFTPGVYQFAISTVDVNGLESRRSETIRVNVI